MLAAACVRARASSALAQHQRRDFLRARFHGVALQHCAFAQRPLQLPVIQLVLPTPRVEFDQLPGRRALGVEQAGPQTQFPRAVRQPVSQWPRLRRNQSWDGPVSFQLLRSGIPERHWG